MNCKLLPLAVAAIATCCFASGVQAGWGRVLHAVPTAPAVVTQRVVVPSTTYYVPARTTYYAPAATYVSPAPVVVQRPVVASPGYVIPPPRIRIRRVAPSLYVAPSVVVPQ
jgi:hypothetical protein